MKWDRVRRHLLFVAAAGLCGGTALLLLHQVLGPLFGRAEVASSTSSAGVDTSACFELESSGAWTDRDAAALGLEAESAGWLFERPDPDTPRADFARMRSILDATPGEDGTRTIHASEVMQRLAGSSTIIVGDIHDRYEPAILLKDMVRCLGRMGGRGKLICEAVPAAYDAESGAGLDVADTLRSAWPWPVAAVASAIETAKAQGWEIVGVGDLATQHDVLPRVTVPDMDRCPTRDVDWAVFERRWTLVDDRISAAIRSSVRASEPVRDIVFCGLGHVTQVERDARRERGSAELVMVVIPFAPVLQQRIAANPRQADRWLLTSDGVLVASPAVVLSLVLRARAASSRRGR